MNLILFGPPGVGKSAVIRFLQYPGNGLIALDIEVVWNDRAMKGRARSLMDLYAQVQKTFNLSPMVVGGAGLDIKIQYPGFKRALLLLKQSEYEARRDRRNELHPEYAKQGEHSVSEWLQATKWDYIIDATGSVEDVGARVAGIAHRVGHGSS